MEYEAKQMSKQDVGDMTARQVRVIQEVWCQSSMKKGSAISWSGSLPWGLCAEEECVEEARKWRKIPVVPCELTELACGEGDRDPSYKEELCSCVPLIKQFDVPWRVQDISSHNLFHFRSMSEMLWWTVPKMFHMSWIQYVQSEPSVGNTAWNKV